MTAGGKRSGLRYCCGSKKADQPQAFTPCGSYKTPLTRSFARKERVGKGVLQGNKYGESNGRGGTLIQAQREQEAYQARHVYDDCHSCAELSTVVSGLSSNSCRS
jgi:hypothetical protein